jgi:hypothetical protein
MTQAELSTPIPSMHKRNHLDWVLPALLKPKSTFEMIRNDTLANWTTPIVILTLVTLLQVILVGNLSEDASMSGQANLPPSFQYYTPEQQAQLEKAMSVSNGPVFTYIFPTILSIGKIWLGWLFVGAGLHLLRTLMGGRGTTRSIMNVAAWAGLPFAVREIVRASYMLLSQDLIRYPGLSGFAPVEVGTFNLFIAELLKHVDVYWIWHVALLILGVRLFKDLAPIKAVVSVLLIQVTAISLQTLPGLLAAQLGNLTIIRPFF